jgi:hypothetical protein
MHVFGLANTYLLQGADKNHEIYRLSGRAAELENNGLNGELKVRAQINAAFRTIATMT